MAYSVEIVKDSINPKGVRLFTVAATFPRFILPQVSTHRMISKSSSSARAIPTVKVLDKLRDDSFIPEYWGANQSGMKAYQEVSKRDKNLAEKIWREGFKYSIDLVERLSGQKPVNRLGNTKLDKHTTEHTIHIHKQIANRLLEPYGWVTLIMTATEWTNFFSLRCSEHAQPEIEKSAYLIAELYYTNVPTKLPAGKWATPFIDDEDLFALKKKKITFDELIKLSVARTARVSYLNHLGTREHIKDFQLYDDLSTNGHWGAFEHCAQSTSAKKKYYGNLRGWVPLRKTFANENITEFDFAKYKEEREKRNAKAN